MPFSAEIGTLSEGVVPITLSGELEQATAGELRDALRAALRLGPDELRLDFGRVTFMDSSGISVVVAAKRWCDDAGCTLTLEALSRTMLQRFQIGGLSELLGLPGAS